ncbi:PREDICTED: axin interactor, dorsalization-associated protein [Miniopterus natalensis]|uniref:axin interactor, dorsalization-associated protein n=1 Tax=Miniopterus natalensis TaxID=291302 RepID=UPI0007A71A1F|nr:PREDICTED: axin interactor, dorsalization-associated protein [Miniopterus natalensis]
MTHRGPALQGPSPPERRPEPGARSARFLFTSSLFLPGAARRRRRRPPAQAPTPAPSAPLFPSRHFCGKPIGPTIAKPTPWIVSFPLVSRLARHLQKEAQAQHNNSEFTEEQKKTIGKIATCLELRSAALQSTQSQEEFKLEDLKKLEPILKNILTYNKEFPFDVQPVPLRRILAPGEEENLEFEEDEEEGGAGAGSPDSFPARVPGTLLPRLPSEPGMTSLTIRIEKIGLKDAGQCIDPYITVSVKDLNGIDLTPVQDTPVASRKEDTYVHFNVDIELQKHVEKLTKGAAIFFEFKHYKPKKRFTSTKCFAFMEMDEVRPGPIVIELYKKPTDFKRKKLQLLTKKPLYLHLHQTLHKE